MRPTISGGSSRRRTTAAAGAPRSSSSDLAAAPRPNATMMTVGKQPPTPPAAPPRCFSTYEDLLMSLAGWQQPDRPRSGGAALVRGGCWWCGNRG